MYFAEFHLQNIPHITP